METLQLSFLTNPSTSLRQDSPAKTSAVRELKKVSPATGLASSLKLSELLELPSLPTLCWKTPPGYSAAKGVKISQKFSGRYPNSGSMQSGLLYLRAPWVPHTCENDCSLWPTPLASLGRKGWPFSSNSKPRYKTSSQERALSFGRMPSPELLEDLLGLPVGWTSTDVKQWVTPLPLR